MEIWKDIKDLEGYQVSNFGCVRSLNYRRTGKVKVLSPCVNTYGYFRVNLCKNGIVNSFLIHRLVADAFIPNPYNLPQVNHKDEDKTNNRVENLEWCSANYNTNYGTCIKRRSNKTRNGKCSKPVLQLTIDGRLVKEWSSIMETERKGFNHSNIIKCCRGVYNKAYGYVWKYKDVV